MIGGPFDWRLFGERLVPLRGFCRASGAGGTPRHDTADQLARAQPLPLLASCPLLIDRRSSARLKADGVSGGFGAMSRGRGGLFDNGPELEALCGR